MIKMPIPQEKCNTPPTFNDTEDGIAAENIPLIMMNFHVDYENIISNREHWVTFHRKRKLYGNFNSVYSGRKI